MQKTKIVLSLIFVLLVGCLLGYFLKPTIDNTILNKYDGTTYIYNVEDKTVYVKLSEDLKDYRPRLFKSETVTFNVYIEIDSFDKSKIVLESNGYAEITKNDGKLYVYLLGEESYFADLFWNDQLNDYYIDVYF